MNKVYYVYNCTNCAMIGFEELDIDRTLDSKDLYIQILGIINTKDFNCSYCGSNKEFLRKKTICDEDSIGIIKKAVKNGYSGFN